MERRCALPSPLGTLEVVVSDAGVTAIRFPHVEPAPRSSPGDRDGSPILARAVRQLEEYFAGERRTFDLPLAPHGTPFEERVWAALQRIPYGARTSYGEIARALGDPKAARAVGAANGRNPIAIVVPCHRVVGSDGRLTGYAGGLERKRWLLEHEAPGDQGHLFPPAAGRMAP